MPKIGRGQCEDGSLFGPSAMDDYCSGHSDEASFAGEAEEDEIYFGGVCNGKYRRVAASNVPVFNWLKRGNRVYAKGLLDTKRRLLTSILEHRIVPIALCILTMTVRIPSWTLQTLHISG